MSGATVGFDGVPVLSDIDLVVERGQKLALIGPNGAGKTTLLNLLLGRLRPMAGTVTLGANVDIAEFAQHQVDALRFDRTVLEELRAAVGEEHGRNLRSVLGSFGFRGDAVDRRVGDLSGGERTRLALARIMVEPGQPAGAGRAHQPPRPAQLRRAGGRARRLSGHGAAGHARPVPDPLRGRRAARGPRRQGDLPPGCGGGGAGAPWHHRGRRAGLGRAGRRGRGGGAGAGRRPNKAEARRQTAGERQARQRSTKDLRSRVQKLERRVLKAEAEVESLHAQLADPEIYDDHQKVRELADLHEAAQEQVASPHGRVGAGPGGPRRLRLTRPAALAAPPAPPRPAVPAPPRSL